MVKIAVVFGLQVFGIFNTLAYAAGAYFLYVEWKSSNTQWGRRSWRYSKRRQVPEEHPRQGHQLSGSRDPSHLRPLNASERTRRPCKILRVPRSEWTVTLKRNTDGSGGGASPTGPVFPFRLFAARRSFARETLCCNLCALRSARSGLVAVSKIARSRNRRNRPIIFENSRWPREHRARSWQDPGMEFDASPGSTRGFIEETPTTLAAPSTGFVDSLRQVVQLFFFSLRRKYIIRMVIL